jgi:hypothetical protein
METAKITFVDGTEISAEKNGDSFILKKRRTFPDDLSVVTVKVGDTETVYRNAVITECASVDGRFWFGISETSEGERVTKKMLADIRTIAELADVDLDAPDPSLEISLKERINDLEIAVCELVDALA